MKKAIHKNIGTQTCAAENTVFPHLAALLFLMAAFFFALPAFAADKAGDIQTIYSPGQMTAGTAGCNSASSKGCDLNNHTWDAQAAASYNVNKYSRQNAKVINLLWNYQVPPTYPETGCPQAYAQVGGEYTCAGNTSWNFNKTSGTLCWPAHTLISPANCKNNRVSQSFSAQQAGGIVSASNACSTGACVVDYQPAASNHFITAATGDNQMAMLPVSAGTKGFLVYNYCGSYPYWMERQSPEPSKYLMIPTKCQDYQTFIDAKPPAVKIEPACHPASMALCPSPPSRPAMPPHPGCGGHGHGSSWCSGTWVTPPPTCTTTNGKTTCVNNPPYCTKYSYCDCGVVDGVGSVPITYPTGGSCPPPPSGSWVTTQPPACPTACGQPAQTLYGSVTCSGGACSGAKPATPTRSCGATAACSTPDPGVWTITQPAACPIVCGQPAQTIYGSVDCTGGVCDPFTKPATPNRYCSATMSCTPTANGSCSTTKNTCTSGNLSNTQSTSSTIGPHYLPNRQDGTYGTVHKTAYTWTCSGTAGGTSQNCSAEEVSGTTGIVACGQGGGCGNPGNASGTMPSQYMYLFPLDDGPGGGHH